ncbi:MAG: VCBS repeat-containing protein, partial [Flavobacteriales bacterium]
MATFNTNGDWKGAAVADLNNDGINELLLSKWYWIGYWDPSIGSTSLTTIAEGTGLPWRFLPADISGDGRKDLITYFGDGVSDSWFRPYLQQPDGTFLAGTTAYFGLSVMDMKVLDLDGDGFMEIWGASEPGIMKFNLTTEGAIASMDTMIQLPYQVARFLVKDVQGDGIPDVLAATMDDRLLLWNGSLGPAFTAPPQVLLEWPHVVATSPISLPSGTGRQDLGLATGTNVPFWSDASTAEFYIVRSDRNGLYPLDHLFLTNDQWFEPYGHNIISDDLDNDGDVDILGCYKSGLSACILYGVKNDQPQYTMHCFGSEIDQTLQTSIRKIDAFDANGDGYPDLHVRGVYSHSNPPPNPPWYEAFDTLLIHSGPWEFTAAGTSLPASYYWDHADLDGDGLQDLVVTEGAMTQLVVYKNLGQGQYLASASVPFDFETGSIGDPDADTDFNQYVDGLSPSFADMDGDGRTDLLRVSRASNSYALLYQKISTDAISDPVLVYEQPLGQNQGTYAIPADIDHDGRVDLLVADHPSFDVYTWTIFHGDGNFPFHNGVVVYQGSTA